jgi:hypothetical protein
MYQAPRLRNKTRRQSTYSGLPQELKDVISSIARREGCSRSWVIERIILQWAGIKIYYQKPYLMVQKRRKKAA